MNQKRTIIQIDGGYLRSAARTDGRKFDPEFIASFALSLFVGEEERLRILYYDCAPFEGTRRKKISGTEQVFAKSDDWLVDLAGQDLFAVRLGVLKWRGWKLKANTSQGTTRTDDDYEPSFEQKGVDLRIGLDIATYSNPRLVDRILLVTGDTDLIPAMKLARRNGVQIVGIELPNHKLSQDLLAHIDLRRRAAWP